MEREHVDLFTCAADAICLDGYVVNKVGTLQIAICANHFGIPTFVTGAPDIGHETKDTVKIEMRDPEFTLQAMGVRTAAQGVKGYYPAFDMTPGRVLPIRSAPLLRRRRSGGVRYCSLRLRDPAICA